MELRLVVPYVRGTEMCSTLVLKANTDVEFENATAFRHEVEEVMGECTDSSVVLDFTQLDYFDSSAIGAIVVLYKELLDQHRGLAIVASKRSMHFLSITGLGELMPIQTNLESAIEHLGRTGGLA